MSEFVFEHHDGVSTMKMFDELTELYLAIHNQPEHHFPMYSREAFTKRTTAQCQREGFELVALRHDDELIGFSFGQTFAAGSWWSGADEPSAAIKDADKLAVIELDVHEDYRLRGFGRQLMDRLLADRPEEYATLVAVVGGDPYAMYLRWGWYTVGKLSGEPVMDALVKDLK